MLFELATKITTATSLMAFIVAAFVVVMRKKLTRDENVIKLASKEDRAELIKGLLNQFHVDTCNLTKSQQFEIAMTQIKVRNAKFALTLKIGVSFGAFLAALAAMSMYLSYKPFSINRSASLKGIPILEKAFLVNSPLLNEESAGYWKEEPISEGSLSHFGQEAKIVPRIVKGYGVDDKGNSVIPPYYFSEPDFRDFLAKGGTYLYWEFSDTTKMQFKMPIFFTKELVQKITAMNPDFDTKRPLSDMIWSSLAYEYANSLINGIPRKRFVIRNSGQANITVYKVISKRIYSNGWGAGAAASELSVTNKDKDISLTYTHDSELQFNNPVVCPPGESAMIEVGIIVERASQFDGGGDLGFSLSLQYHDGVKLEELKLGYYSMADNHGYDIF